MSTTIDQRVVEMQFDNEHFERNVATSMSTLKKLDQSLQLQGATKGLEGINAAAKSVNLSGLGSAVETVGLKFSAMYTMADQCLRNITNSAYRAGERMVKALTIDPIKTGFQEYETQINAVQTILANTKHKGTTIDQVNEALDTLNTYADKTIYNFTEMTRNIGTFTAAGVDLDKSVTSIKGIANLAAVSGSTSQQASTAMYQLSQALAAGRVSLMDWNSVVNAGMGGEVFQNALKRTAENLGTNVDAMIEKYGSFRESLTKGEWLTAEVLTETLTQLSGAYSEADLLAKGYSKEQAAEILDLANTAEEAATKVKTFTQLFDTLKEAAQSGWTQTWEIIVGDFEEAKKLLTRVSEVIGGVIGASAESRNAMLQGWKDMGGRTALIEGLTGAFEGLVSIITPIKEAFKNIFPADSEEKAKWLYNLTMDMAVFLKGLKLSDTASKNLRRTFEGIFAVLDIVRQAIVGALQVISPLFGGFTSLSGGILGVTAVIGDWLVKLNESIKQGDIFNKTFELIANVIETVITSIKNFATAVKDMFVIPGMDAFAALFDRVSERMDSVNSGADGMKTGVVGAISAMGTALANSDFVGLLRSLWEGVKTLGSAVATAFGALTSSLINTLGDANFDGLFDFINTLTLSGIGVFIAKFVKGFSDAVESVGSFKEGVLDILDEAKGCFEAYQNQLKAGTLMKIAQAIAVLVASLVVLSLIDSEKLSGAIGAITVLFTDLMAAMAVFNKVSGDFKRVGKGITAMIGISTAVLILSSAMAVMSTMNFEELSIGLLGIVGLMGTLIGAIKILGKGDKVIIKGAAQMVIFTAAIKVLASVCMDLSTLKWSELAKGLIGVGGLVAAVAGFLKTAKFDGKAMSTATGIVILSGAIKVLASACKDFGSLDTDVLVKGLAGVGAVLLGLSGFTKLTSGSTNMMSIGVSMIAIGAAMKIFADATKDFGSLKWDEIGKGLAAMAGALFTITVALKALPSDILATSVGLIAVGGALTIIANVMKQMGGMTWEEIGSGLVVLAGSLLTISVALTAMTGTLAGSAALLVASAALAVLTPVMLALGNMSWTEICKGLVTLAGAFAVIGAAGYLLAPVVPAILGLSAAFAAIGVGVLAFGAGLVAAGAGISAIAIGMSALATAVAGGATGIVAGLTVIVTGIGELIPFIAEKLGEAIVAFCGVIADGAPALGEAVKALILSILDVVGECLPEIVECVLSLLTNVWGSLAEHTPEIIDHMMTFLIALIDGLAERMPELIESGVNLIMQFFSGIIDALSGIDVGTLAKGLAGVGLIAGIMAALSAVSSLIPGAMVGVLGMGAIIAELALVLAAVGALAQIPGLEWLISEGGDFLMKIGSAIGQFIGGIVGGIGEGITASLPEMATNLSNFMTNLQPFIDGARSLDESILTNVGNLADIIMTLTAANLVDSIASFLGGGNSLADFGMQLVPFGMAMATFSKIVSGVNEEAVSASARVGTMLATMADTIPNTGGLISWFAGDNDLATFGSQLILFGEAMVEFSKTVAGNINEEAIMAAASAGSILATLANSLPESGGIASIFTADDDMSTFGKEIVKFGEAMADFSEEVTDINIEAMSAAITACRNLANMAKYLTGVDFGSITAFEDALGDMGTDGVDKFIDAFEDGDTKAIKAVKDMVESAADAIEDKVDDFEKSGSKSAKKFADGIDENAHKAEKKAKTMASDAADASKDKWSEFYDAGKYLVSGFASGITINTFKAEAAAAAMAKAALEAAEDELDIQSPSKKAYKTGTYFSLGFVNSIDDHISNAKESGAGIAKAAQFGLTTALSKLRNIIESDIDTQPTIRPVLDLSDVRSSASDISSLFDRGPSIGVRANVAAISSSVNGRSMINNGDVVTAIDKLRSDLGNVGNTTYQINGVTYDDGSNITDAVRTIVRAAKIGRRS